MTKHHGLLLVDKPTGITSHDVVAKIRKIFQTKEVGHSGTLDPLASGLMVILLGEATKLSAYITEGDKAYDVQIRPGIETDTLDITGKIISEKPVKIASEQIIEAGLKLVGELNLPIPLYSAKKIDGQKMYELARDNQAPAEIPSKIMKFWGVKNISTKNEIEFSISCSIGSFIRSWVKLLGEKIECGATMSGLRRTQSHHFNLTDSISIEKLQATPPDQLQKLIVPLNEALPTTKKIKAYGKDAVLLKNGQISHDLRTQLVRVFNPDQDQLVQILPESGDGLLALIALEPGIGFKIRRIFNMPTESQ